MKITTKNKFSALLLFAMLCINTACGQPPDEQESKSTQFDTSTIAVAGGYSHEEETHRRFPDANILKVVSIADVVLMVMSGKADYGVLDLPVARTVVESNLDLEIVADSTLFAKQIVAGFSPNNSALLAEFNIFIKEFVNSETFEDIIFRWREGHGGALPNIPTLDEGKILNIGVDSESPPYCMSKRGELHGISVEIIKHFALDCGYQLRLHDMSSEALEASLAAQKLDATLTGHTKSQQSKTLLYSYVYYTVPVVMISRVEKILKATDNNEKYSIDNLSKSTIAVAVGSSHEYFVTKYFTDAEIIRVNSFSEVYPRVRSQGVRYGVLDMPLLVDIASKHRDVDIVDDNLFTIDIGVAFAKENDELRDEFNRFYWSFKGSKTYKDMVSRWLVDGSGGKIPHIEQAQSDKVLRLGTCTMSPPNSLLIDNVIEGFEIELIRHFALENGYRLEIYDMSIGLVVPSLEAGRIDMIAAGLCITEARQRRVLFSDPHQKIAAGVFQVTDQIDDVKQSLFSSIKDSFYNNLIRESRYEQIGDGLMVTIKISLLAILLGSVLGCWVYGCASSSHHIVRWCGIGYITLIRGIPVLVLLMLNFYLVFSKSALPPIAVAVVTFALSFAADIADRLRAIIKKGELQSLGQIFTLCRLNRIVPAYKSEAVSLIKSTSIVGYIAMEDVTRVSYVIRSGTFDAFFPLILTAIIYFVLSYLFSLLIDILISQYKYLFVR